MKYRYIPLALLSALTVATASEAQTIRSAPRLVVSITIDQLRTDYLEAFAPLYSANGFKRLLNQGLVYTNVSYPFSPIDRASAVAAVVTGTTPYYNTITGGQWLDRETLRPVVCTDDKKYPGLSTNDTSSPRNLSTSSVGDELKATTNGKAIVYAIAPFRDAAVLSAGHAADGALWIDDNNGYWCSSQYYYKNLPSWLSAYNEIKSVAKKIQEKVWTPQTELSGNFSYFMNGGMQKPFSHKFSGARRFRQYKASALVNTDITDMAMQCLGSCGMGLDATTDLLNLTYYAGNFDHQTVGECQMELQDTYVKLDGEIERLINLVEKKIGGDNVLFVITGTGYSDEENTDYAKYRIPTGTFYMNRIANLLNMYMGGLWGQERYVETCFGAQIYLNHKTFEQKKVSFAEACDRAQEFLSLLSGVRNVYTSLQLLSSATPETRKIRNGFNLERNGDILIEVAPGWRLLNEDNLDNQLVRASFVQFPLIIYGAGTKAERIAEPITTDRIAPTLAKAIRIRAPNACSSEPLF
jgi:hypothetical protein